MSKASLHNQIDEVKNLFYTYQTYISFVGMSMVTFILLNFFLIISGNQYLKTDPMTGNVVDIVQYFLSMVVITY
jgi:hypothetical protein